MPPWYQEHRARDANSILWAQKPTGWKGRGSSPRDDYGLHKPSLYRGTCDSAPSSASMSQASVGLRLYESYSGDDDSLSSSASSDEESESDRLDRPSRDSAVVLAEGTSIDGGGRLLSAAEHLDAASRYQHAGAAHMEPFKCGSQFLQGTKAPRGSGNFSLCNRTGNDSSRGQGPEPKSDPGECHGTYSPKAWLACRLYLLVFHGIGVAIAIAIAGAIRALPHILPRDTAPVRNWGAKAAQRTQSINQSTEL